MVPVSIVPRSFKLPDPAGRAGGACTSTLLNILYKDETVPEDDLSFTQVLTQMRDNLKAKGFTQIPQLTSANPIDVNTDFDLVPKSATGTKRAVMIGINYVGHDPGELRGCHNDVLNMKKYIMNVHGFEEDNIHVLMDDGNHEEPTMANMVAAYKKIVAESESGGTSFVLVEFVSIYSIEVVFLFLSYFLEDFISFWFVCILRTFCFTLFAFQL